jgi:O6-methylguanine-DNA--protein-cysteine methyltransferase
VGGALAANPVPLSVPCHRVVRGDGTWGPYALSARLKTRLLALERRIVSPAERARSVRIRAGWPQ